MVQCFVVVAWVYCSVPGLRAHTVCQRASCIVSCISDWGVVFFRMEADNITLWAEMQTMNGEVREGKHCLTRICHS